MDGLEDVSAGGRVTRSLRKRLTSVDSNEQVSRPSTPQLVKLAAIPETSTPSRSLRTRRNSTTGNATPSKTVKSKASAIAESNDLENTPSKRTTRRSSVSAAHAQTPNKSYLEDTATDNASPLKPVVKESSIAESNDLKNHPAKRTTRLNSVPEDKNSNMKDISVKRATRSHSKSPQQMKMEKTHIDVSPKKIKPESESKSSKNMSESDSDDEIINLIDKQKEEIADSSPKNGGKSAKTPTRLSPRIKGVNNSKDQIEIIDLSDDTLVTDDEKTDKTGNPLEVANKKEVSTVEVLLSEPICKVTSEQKEPNEKILPSEPIIEVRNAPQETDAKCLLSESTSKVANEKGEEADMANEKDETSAETLRQDSPDIHSMKNSYNKEYISKNDSTLHLELSDDDEEVNTNAKTPEENELPPRKQPGPLIKSVIMLQKLSPKVIAKLCDENNVLSPKSPKSVTFNNHIEEDAEEKTVYPKTPASTKSKSYIANDYSKDYEDKSIPSSNSSAASFKDASEYIESQNRNESHNDINQSELHNISNNPEKDNSIDEAKNTENSTPYKHKIPALIQSSTPVPDSILNSKCEQEANVEKITEKSPDKSQKESPKKANDQNTVELTMHLSNATKSINSSDLNDMHQSPNRKEISITSAAVLQQQQLELTSTDANNVTEKNSGTEVENNEKNFDLFSKSWTHNVSGCATSDQKLDIISTNTSINKSHHESDSNTIQILEKEKTLGTMNEVNTNDNASEASDDSFQKLELVDHEAMEVSDNYQSGDSMDEEERKEMEEHEILDEGESIGSEDTLSDGGSNDADDDDENASFVTSDSEESLLEYSDDDEHFEDTTKKSIKTKRNGNIIVTSESDDADENKSSNHKSSSMKKVNTTNRRNCILVTSESENEEQSTGKSKEDGNTTDKNLVNKPLNFNVTKMIDSTTDDEVNANETLSQKHNDNRENEDLNDASQNIKLNSDINEITFNNTKDKSVDCEIEPSDESSIPYNNNNTSTRFRRKSLSTSMCQIFDTNCNNQANVDVGDKINNSNEDKNKNSNITNDESIKSPASIINEIINVNKVFLQNENHYKPEEGNSIPQSENECSEMEGDENDDEDEDEDIVIPETQEIDRRVNNVFNKRSVDEDPSEEINSNLNGASNLKNVGLSVSFCQAKASHNIKTKKTVHHSSFTIGVRITQNSQMERPNDSNQIHKTNDTDKINDIELDIEEEKLENRKHSTLKLSTAKRKRQSMASYDGQEDIEEPAYVEESKRKSLQLLSINGFNPSQSLIENIESRKHELDTIKGSKTRLSKSFCENITHHESDGLEESSSTASSNSNDQSENKDGYKISSTPHKINTTKQNKDYSNILERCDKILEAANSAKLEAKQKNKKDKEMLPKSNKSSKQSSSSEEVADYTKDVEPSKVKNTFALEQALKASAKILLNVSAKKKKEKHSLQINKDEFEHKRLPMQLLHSLQDYDSMTKLEKKKSNEKTRSPLVHRMNCPTGEIIEEVLTPQKKKRVIFNKFELPTGIVLEEPVTPRKKSNMSGFRESPITPRNLGFKVRNILTAGQDKIPELRTPYHAEQKRKRKIADTEHLLPKPQWSQSGVFLEEILPNCNDKKRFKFHDSNNCGSVESSSALNALNFKNSTIFRKNVPRESTQEVLKRKERQYVSRKNF